MSVFGKFTKKLVNVLTALALGVTTLNFAGATQARSTEVSEAWIKEKVNEMAMDINAERKAIGLQELYCVPYLMDCAETRACEASEVWGHLRPDGKHFTEIIDNDIVKWWYIFENLTAGYDTAESAMESFRNSPNHWAAITNPDITYMGVGLCYNPEGFGGCEFYWCQIFVKEQREDYEYPGQYLPQSKIIVPADEGDVNGDSTINSFDYITLVEYIRKKQEGTPVYLNEAQLEAADCFQDGRITEADAKAMQRFIIGEYTELPYVF